METLLIGWCYVVLYGTGGPVENSDITHRWKKSQLARKTHNSMQLSRTNASTGMRQMWEGLQRIHLILHLFKTHVTCGKASIGSKLMNHTTGNLHRHWLV